MDFVYKKTIDFCYLSFNACFSLDKCCDFLCKKAVDGGGVQSKTASANAPRMLPKPTLPRTLTKTTAPPVSIQKRSSTGLFFSCWEYFSKSILCQVDGGGVQLFCWKYRFWILRTEFACSKL